MGRFSKIALLVISISAVLPNAQAELRAFRLKITDTSTGTDRVVLSRLDDIQYRQYFALKKTEIVSIEQTWMCYQRSDYTSDASGSLCSAPVAPGPVTGDLDRSPASTPPSNVNSPSSK